MLPAVIVQPHGTGSPPFKKHLAARGQIQPGNEGKHRRFAAAGFSDHRIDAPAFKCAIDATQRLHLLIFAFICVRYVLQFKHGAFLLNFICHSRSPRICRVLARFSTQIASAHPKR